MQRIKPLLLKTIFVDEDDNTRLLEIRHWPKIGLELIYTCIIDGTKTIDIRIENDEWYDLRRQEDHLANKFGTIIKNHL